MANTTPMSANEFVEQQLDQRARELEQTMSCHMLSLIGDIVGGVDDVIRNVVEEKRRQSADCEKLTVLVTTLGGYIEVVQRIVETLRHHYGIVEFIVPNYAFSAGDGFGDVW